jgi:nicotinate-nucleotide adenylyltransferase
MPSSDISNRIGVFGGTFDPVHNGHLAIARAVREELNLDKILFIAVADQWLRDNPPVAPAKDRFRMVELAVENSEFFEASDVDIVRGGSTYTVDTLSDLRRLFGDEVELKLIVGVDSALSMDRWDRAEELGTYGKVVVVGRPGLVFEPDSLDSSHPAKGAEYVEGPMIDVSATRVRELIRSDDSIEQLVPEPVSEYIAKNGLYR